MRSTPPRIGPSSPPRSRSGAGPRKTSSTPTIRDISDITRSAECRSGLAALVSTPISDTSHEWQGYMPFDDLPNAFDPPSGFLATANSRVTSEKSKYPLTNEWADPYRAERIYKLLQGRDHLTPADMLAVQTDIYSEMDQEMAHRLAYAIDHSANADDQLRKAADLLRNWDGRLTTDSVAASIEVNTRYTLRSMLLEPKLGKDLAASYQWSESNFAEEEIVMHAGPDWLPPDYKRLGRIPHRCRSPRHQRRQCSADLSKWTYGSWHFVEIEHPLSGFLPVIGRMAGTGKQPLSGDTITVKQVGRDLRPIAALHHGLEQHRRINRKHRPGRKRQSLQPLLPRSVERLLQRPHLRAALHSRRRHRQHPAHPPPAAMKKQGPENRDQGSGPDHLRPGRRCRWSKARSAIRRSRSSSASPPSSPPRPTSSGATPAATTSTSISPRGSTPRQLATRPLLSALGRQPQLGSWRTALRLLPAAHLDAWRRIRHPSSPGRVYNSPSSVPSSRSTGLATRSLARHLGLTEGPATLAGCAALFSGYSMFTAYERSAFGELAGGLLDSAAPPAYSARSQSAGVRASSRIRRLRLARSLLSLPVHGSPTLRSA